MLQLQILVQNIGAMFLVICAGWILRRRGYLGAEAGSLLSRLVVDVTLPCLIVTQMLRTTTLAAFQKEWPCVVLGAVEIFLPWLAALPLANWFAPRQQRPTFRFLVAMPNWIYLPLPIIKGLYGDDGVRILLLYNVGVQLTLWSFGVWILRGEKLSRQAWAGLLGNVGLWATILGTGVALILPSPSPFSPAGQANNSWLRMPLDTLLQAVEMIGSLTIPTSLLAIGLQQGGYRIGRESLSTSTWGVVVGRLLLAPAFTIIVVSILLGSHLPETMRMVGYLVATMPVALSCSVMAERYGGDVVLSAQSIFWTTLFSVGTVPALFWAMRQFHL